MHQRQPLNAATEDGVSTKAVAINFSQSDRCVLSSRAQRGRSLMGHDDIRERNLDLRETK